MEVLASVGRPDPRRSRQLADRAVRLTSIEELFARADVVCLSVPLSEDTRGLVGERLLGLMKQDAVLVNVSRGGVVDEAALLSALRSGTLAGAATDVLARESGRTELADLENVVLTPHIGALTQEAQRRIGERVVELLDADLAA
jgi:phosphoglycerate dehydrogenase-like enzyme